MHARLHHALIRSANDTVHLGGVVLSQVDPKKHAYYGSGDSGYYHRAVRKYYTN